METTKFTGEEGTFISSSQASQYISRFHERKKREGSEVGTYVEAQFFGKNQLQKLMKKDDCVGLRIYFGVSESKELTDQVVVVAVDANGKDLTRTRIGLKDMPTGDDDALAGGPCCPHACNP